MRPTPSTRSMRSTRSIRSKGPLITLRPLLTCLLLTLSTMAAAYDYTTPMPGVKGLPLEMPEQPFVLRFTQEELLAQPIWADRVDGILVPTKPASPIRVGAEALRATLSTLGLGDTPIIEVAPNEQEFPATLKGTRYIVLAPPQDLALAANLAREAALDVSDATLNGDGFYVKPLKRGERSLLLVTSPLARGVMYGAYELEERTTKRGVPAVDDKFAPLARYRGWSIFNGVPIPKKISGRFRYNLSVEYGSLWTRTLPLKDYPELGGEQYAKEIASRQGQLHEVYADVLAYGSMPALFFNPLSLQAAPVGIEEARKILSAKSPGILAQPADRYIYSLCPSHPETHKLAAAMMRELARTFPELEVIVLQLSDEGGELICDCDACKKHSYYEKVVEYTKLAIDAAREVNPKLRFMIFGSGITNKGMADNPDVGRGPTMGMDYIWKGVGADLDAVVLMATSPPGFDVQTWFSKNSTMLGQGLPLYFYLNWYEAGAPGIVAPIAAVMSHLSWPLPLYLDKLKAYGAPGGGMIGASSPVAGMDAAWWYPNLDPHKYMRNWCRAKYGHDAGALAYEAMVDTDKITSAFHLDTKPDPNESLDMYRWGAPAKPWAIDMDPLAKVGLGKDDTGQTSLASIAQLGFMFPQAAQPAAFKTLVPGDEMEKWRARFALAEEVAIAERAEAKMAQAVKANGDNPELRRLYAVARASHALVVLFKDYHLAMVDASAARNVQDADAKARLANDARALLKRASENVVIYKESMLPLTKPEPIVRLKRDVDMLYVSAVACMVREAAYLFDQEFGGESVLSFYDQAIGIGAAR